MVDPSSIPAFSPSLPLPWLGSPAAFEAGAIQIGVSRGLAVDVMQQMVPALRDAVLADPHNVRIGLPPGSRWIVRRKGDGCLTALGYDRMMPHVDPISWHISFKGWWPAWFAWAPAQQANDRMALHLGFQVIDEFELLSPPRGAFLDVRVSAIEPALRSLLEMLVLTAVPGAASVQIRGFSADAIEQIRQVLQTAWPASDRQRMPHAGPGEQRRSRRGPPAVVPVITLADIEPWYRGYLVDNGIDPGDPATRPPPFEGEEGDRMALLKVLPPERPGAWRKQLRIVRRKVWGARVPEVKIAVASS